MFQLEPDEGEEHFMAYMDSEISLACLPNANTRLTTAVRMSQTNVLFVANKKTYKMFFFAQVLEKG